MTQALAVILPRDPTGENAALAWCVAGIALTGITLWVTNSAINDTVDLIQNRSKSKSNEDELCNIAYRGLLEKDALSITLGKDINAALSSGSLDSALHIWKPKGVSKNRWERKYKNKS